MATTGKTTSAPVAVATEAVVEVATAGEEREAAVQI